MTGLRLGNSLSPRMGPRGGVAEVVTYALDAVTATPSFAGSTRKLKSTYSGPCMKVRRSSDNAEQDIGFASNGTVDAAALDTFAAGSTLYVTTLYDQSGNGRHAVQATALDQHIINNWLMRGVRGITGRQTDQGLAIPTFALERSTMSALMVGGGYQDQMALMGLDASGRGFMEYVNPWLTIPDEQASSTPAHVRVPYGMELFGYNRNGSTLTKFSSEMQATDTGLFTSAYSGPFTLGAYRTYNLVLKGAFEAALIFDVALSAGDLEALRSGLETAYSLSRTKRAVVGIVGDSIVAGTAASEYVTPGFAVRTRADLPAAIHMVNYGSGSAKSSDFSTCYASLKAAALTLMDAVVHQFGTNDIGLEGASAATIQSRAQANCAAIRADGSKALDTTMTPANHGSQSVRNAVNAWKRANWASYCDGLVDLAADSIIGPDAAAFDTTLYPDQLHPSPLNLSYQGKVYRDAIVAAV